MKSFLCAFLVLPILLVSGTKAHTVTADLARGLNLPAFMNIESLI